MRKSPKKTIHKKLHTLHLRCIIPLTILLLIGAFLYSDLAETNKTSQIVNQDIFYIGQGAGALSHNLKQITRDLLYLASQRSLIDQISQPEPEHLKKLTENFINFSETKGYYDQIRWIDETGMERVRVDYAPAVPKATPTNRLQNKSE
ncbi:MAG: hypothetical protein D3910_25230, partial [Candidatus Electrothrix sp. ATG2]|nr:hypothetical protein [Candidatus Electrothrix sp. ATG2]